MIAQSKTIHQAEIDAACEFADFLRFNVKFAEEIYNEQPISSDGTWNKFKFAMKNFWTIPNLQPNEVSCFSILPRPFQASKNI